MKSFQFKKPSRRDVLHFLRYLLMVLLGNALAAAGSAFFVLPNHFVMGGTTGIGIFVRNLVGAEQEWIVSLTVYVANMILFAIGAWLLGKKFALATLAGTLLYPTFMTAFNALYDVYEARYGAFTTNPLLAAICGALIFGLGIGIAIRVGASTGGTDIPPVIFQKYFNWPVSVTLWVLDFSIVLLQLVAPDIGAEEILYGVVITLISSIAVEKISPIGRRRAQVKIVSRNYRVIREKILGMDRGVTLLYGKTGFLKEHCFVLLTVVSHRELVKLKNMVYEADPDAFMTISDVSEVRGRGFSSEKVLYPRSEERADPEDLVEVSPDDERGDRTPVGQ